MSRRGGIYTGHNRRGKLRLPPHAHPAVMRLFEEMNAQRTQLAEVAVRAGVGVDTLRFWGTRHMPRVDLLDAALNTLGLRLAVVPIREDAAVMLCDCENRPRCECRACDDYASWSVWQPRWAERPARFVFMCDWHWQNYHDAMTKPMIGLDPRHDPPDEDWRPSLIDMVRLCEAEMRRQDAVRQEREREEAMEREVCDYDRKRFARMPPGQVRTIMRYRALCRL